MKLTKEQAIIITGYTGIFCFREFSHFQEDAEKRLGHPIWTHQFGDKEFANKIKEVYREGFIAMIPEN